MPRDNKENELRKWISTYKSYVYLVKYQLYVFTVVVLANTESESRDKAIEQYPEAKEIVLVSAHNRTHI